jgi:hypothetical protein
LELVQDAFGNYVVQYILDLGEPTLSEPVILKFRGMICDLAKQKFSSNVIEKVSSPMKFSSSMLIGVVYSSCRGRNEEDFD